MPNQTNPATPDMEHDPLCSEGQYAGDQRMPCDCRVAASPDVPPAQEPRCRDGHFWQTIASHDGSIRQERCLLCGAWKTDVPPSTPTVCKDCGGWGDYGGVSGVRTRACEICKGSGLAPAALPSSPTGGTVLSEQLDEIELVANSLGDVARIGWSRGVDAKRWASDNELTIREALKAIRAAQPPQEEQP